MPRLTQAAAREGRTTEPAARTGGAAVPAVSVPPVLMCGSLPLGRRRVHVGGGTS
jgi:hypothetical protein